LPDRAPLVTPDMLQAIVAKLLSTREEDPMTVLRQQNQELLQSLEEIRRRQQEAEQLSRELADTNRGVVALYAELDARAEQLRHASEMKSRFLSSVSHEFRTPLNSIMALCALLLEGVDGELSSEQRRQIGYLRKSAHELLELVDDLLDLAKVEAGKVEVRSVQFTVRDLFGALRGALKPLRGSGEVDLVFEPADDLPPMCTDERKVSQVLRNLISNALKFTERGEVRVSARYDAQRRRMTFVVTDTGIGIAPENRERIFEEFSQVEGALQKRSAGTGLGLSVSRRLAELLGGEVWLDSELGRGSQFYLTVPVVYAGLSQAQTAALEPSQRRTRVLVIDDDETFRYVLRQFLSESR